jgi:AcrR family transcriptional regulator
MDFSEKPASADAPSGRKQRGATRRADTKRDRIVRLAAKLFLEKGNESVSINDIIDVVGGSKATIYANFGSKEGLFEAVVEQMCSDVTIHIDTRPIGTIEEQLTRIAYSFVSKVLSPQIMSFHRLMTSIGRDYPKAGRLFYETGPKTVYRLVGDWIALHQKAGNLRADQDPHRLAVLFHDMLIGEHVLSWLTSASSEKDRAKRIDETVQLAVTIFLQGSCTIAQSDSTRHVTKSDRA